MCSRLCSADTCSCESPSDGKSGRLEEEQTGSNYHTVRGLKDKAKKQESAAMDLRKMHFLVFVGAGCECITSNQY